MIVRVNVMEHKRTRGAYIKRLRPKVRGMKKNLTGIPWVSNVFWLKEQIHFSNYGEQEENLHPWKVAEEDSNTKSSNGGKKYIYILRWRVLDHA